MSQKAVNVAIIGAGLVGSAFISQISRLSKTPISYNVILIARSTKALISKDYSPLTLGDDWQSRLNSSSDSLSSTGDIAAYLEKSPLPVILVDNTSNESLAQSYPLLISQGISIATPNKKGFSSDLGLWNSIFEASAKPKGGLVYHEATVGAGLPIIGTLNDLVNTGDEVLKIEGIFSGSLSFIFNEFSKPTGSDVKFSDVVTKAKELGYTEPDPREDLNGLDVARKVTILSRLAGNKVQGPSSFPVHSLIPKPLERVETAGEFLEKLPQYDADLDKLRQEASSENKVLRFVGKVDLTQQTPSVAVALEKYDNSHPFASLKGSDNVIAFTTKRYPNPIIIQGAGAGDAVTAAGVLGDVIKIAQRL
ncbi:uncharacterized protein SAPINGB_P004682 [Magnusiomyces paraingens]|uniref:Homoserine dehydrogenase n=1 Tax=Magnusiomyces paraingens TaxID=2606893 RepID=A0A5E8C1M3_9ASCO|nr:uncharacterized protein SAPINGB_P004682 [Saprochaete ingens]VVT55657.1 unnamed protein product [Saprochaete ingens]